MAHCSKCNSILDKFEVDVCEACKAQKNKPFKPLTKRELDKLKKVLSDFEVQTKCETGIYKLSGGFASADMFDYDNEYIDFELKWGVVNDVENRKVIEQYKINRKTWKIVD